MSGTAPWREGSEPPPKPASRTREAIFYLLAAAWGIAAGWVEVAVDDLLFTALLVLTGCMLLGMLRPRWPWRWVVVVGIFIPLSEIGAFLISSLRPTRAQIWGSFLAFLPGTVGAYAGALFRTMIANLQETK